MAPNPPAPPPFYRHDSLTRSLTPSAAQALLGKYLLDSQTTPWRHPDSLLRASGIAFPPHAGPQGGLALHHLRRIAAGLRGENLVTETVDELVEQFGDEAAAAAGGRLLPEGDDTRLDALIAGKNSGPKRKRLMDESRVDAWAEDTAVYRSSSEAAFGDVAHRGHTEGVEQDWEKHDHSKDLWGREVGTRDSASETPMARSEKSLQEDKAAKRAAKKEKRKAEKREREVARKEG
ncbi:hypothetical protein M433DRAFT_130163 [Acidomyces richmondensis BFW]|nr:MAG: hypothetical protein FE78DRAFT_68381 [Acidomyces sp. 'richmondensis']KYG50667.1 hypothetical protein M433DRAFT_130163 [Acidomyces richmondensis BFW]